MKHILTIILSIVCWVGSITAEVFCGFTLWLLFRELFGEAGMSMTEYAVSMTEYAVTLLYLLALFTLGPTVGITAFRMRYRHHQPSHRQAKMLVALAIITFVLLLPTCYFLIVGAFDLDVIITPFARVIGIVLSLIIPISSVTLCYYVLKHALQQLTETHKH
ncbi:MAG: hypothetical protein MJZ67_02965 [Bacteroidales bacterium]|nr:hypothetical protein [Bacteroidales bacterium]